MAPANPGGQPQFTLFTHSGMTLSVCGDAEGGVVMESPSKAVKGAGGVLEVSRSGELWNEDRPPGRLRKNQQLESIC